MVNNFLLLIKTKLLTAISYKTPLPFFINGNHWVAITHRIINNIINFYYSNNVNSTGTKTQEKYTSQHTNADFTMEVILAIIHRSRPSITFIKPQFSSLLQSGGWNCGKHFFAANPDKSSHCPHLQDTSIMIPFFINGNHWVAVTHRIINT
jgi:hypothetical protein